MADDAYISLPILANPWHVSLSAFSIPSLVSLLAIAMGTSSRRNATTAEALLLALMLSSSAARAAAADPGFSCGPSSPSRSLPFCDRSLPAARRAADLVSRMTVAEKVSQMGDEAAGVPRLGVPPYKYWSEGLHGLAFWGHGLRFDGAVRGVTSFPQVLLTAASFDEGLWFRIGQVSTPPTPLLGMCLCGLTFSSTNVICHLVLALNFKRLLYTEKNRELCMHGYVL